MTKTPAQQYTNLYLFMLIISLVFIIASLGTFLQIPHLLGVFSIAPAYVAIELAANFSIILTIVAIALLAKKQRLGLTLLYIDCILGIICGIGLVLVSDQILVYMLSFAGTEELADPMYTSLTNIMPFVIYIGIGLQTATLVSFTYFWRMAWQRQYRVDNPRTSAIKQP